LQAVGRGPEKECREYRRTCRHEFYDDSEIELASPSQLKIDKSHPSKLARSRLADGLDPFTGQ
jgi:hypothetical protein